ncbi:integrase [Sphingomonas sp. Leaf339]|uniref:tyrosine-type recombinase/integrase n=1 Tax=Sphingomonas sp. Leaf339 TaxID=1736343 RepID=UPI0006F5A2B5|nr:site-specific integrase [Sphingomonas sp. Leaf339]KQU46955.1 integrase [Sphingomonas sp. Leaf339]
MPHPARVLEHGDVRRILRHVATRRHAHRDRVLVLLSFKAGLRACEMAGLTWPMVLKPDGRISDHIFVAATIAKNKFARRIPLHPQLVEALSNLHDRAGRPRVGPVVRSERGTHLTPRSLVNWFAATYASLALDGCSSHSGRRTFITRSARLLTRTGGSLRDVQELAGHKRLTTTECYIEGDRDAQRRLIRLV